MAVLGFAPMGERRRFVKLEGGGGYAGRMYAIAFDMDTKLMEEHSGKASYNNGYAEIEKALRPHGFTKQQGSVYFGDPATVDAVKTVIAIQDVAAQLPWFASSVKDVRMLRIEENNDLSAALPAAPPKPASGPEPLPFGKSAAA